jgi:RNA polymerase sigma factor (sigma-70 family)
MAELARCLRRLVTTADAETDADLLTRFITERDATAFAALVGRYGPMVLAVCQRVLRHRQDAEDAFQATFLVLARRAEAVKPRSLLGNWLYGVAYRTAVGCRRVALARRTREAKVALVRVDDRPPDDGTLTELRAALDRELSALPAVYRASVVACDLEGLSRREAANRLGWTEGTLSSRLARARALLARRLAHYALTVPVAGLGVVAGPVSVGAELAEPTVRLGTLLAVGDAVVAAPVAELVEATMKTMVLAKFKALAAALVVGCAVTLTAVAGWTADERVAPVRAGEEQPKEPKVPDPPLWVGPKSDKERIAELERERAVLLKLLAELQARLEKAEQRPDVAAKAEKGADEKKADGRDRPRIAMFNMNAVMRDFAQAKYQVWLLNKKRAELSKQLVAWRDEHRNLQAALRDKPDHPKKVEMTQDMAYLARKIEDEERKLSKQLNEEASATISDLYDKMKVVVDKTAEINGYHVVQAYPGAATPEELKTAFLKEMNLKPQAAQPFFIAPHADITAVVVDTLNKWYPPVDADGKPVDVNKLKLQ